MTETWLIYTKGHQIPGVADSEEKANIVANTYIRADRIVTDVIAISANREAVKRYAATRSNEVEDKWELVALGGGLIEKWEAPQTS